jgi:hypothetical protein
MGFPLSLYGFRETLFYCGNANDADEGVAVMLASILRFAEEAAFEKRR